MMIYFDMYVQEEGNYFYIRINHSYMLDEENLECEDKF